MISVARRPHCIVAKQAEPPEETGKINHRRLAVRHRTDAGPEIVQSPDDCWRCRPASTRERKSRHLRTRMPRRQRKSSRNQASRRSRSMKFFDVMLAHMPICEADPWRIQYFASAHCPADVRIPTEDSDAWTWNPRHRWVYDRIAIAQSQGMDAGPHGTPPPRFPVFSKPIVNLKGMGLGTRVLRIARGLRPALHGGAHVDDAAHRPARELGRGGRRRQSAVVAPRHRASGRRRDVRLLDHSRGSPNPRSKLRSAAGSRAPRRLYRDGQPRDRRRLDHRNASARNRSVAGSLRPRMGRRARPSLFARRMDIRRPRSSRRLQRRAVRSARRAVAASFAATDRGHPVAPRRVERPDHLPRGSRSAVARDAARRLSPRDHQRLEPRGRPRRSQSAAHVFPAGVRREAPMATIPSIGDPVRARDDARTPRTPFGQPMPRDVSCRKMAG